MQPATTCPSNNDLQRLLLGRVDDREAEELEAHLAQCDKCSEELRKIPADDALVGAMRTPGPAAETPEQELVHVLVPLLKRLQPVEGATQTWGESKQSSAASLTSGSGSPLLALPEAPGEIGRLGPYGILEVLGAGGMGVVFRGFDFRLQRAVAIKVVRAELVSRPGMIDRFFQEAQAIARVEHDNIVVIHSVENHGEVPCIVMPLLRGESLDQRLGKTEGPLPLPDLLRVGRETATGLAAAHEKGLIHRDIKPANLWLESRENNGFRTKILDFGLAYVRATDSEGPSGISGTPGYLSPEQACGKTVDHRSDFFSLGCVLYRMAAGVPPFANAKTFTSLVRVVVERPPPIAGLNAQLPTALVNLIERLLEKDPESRPESANEVVEVLAGIENEEHVRRVRKSRRRWMLAVAGAVAVGGGGVWMMQTPRVVEEAKPVKVTLSSDVPGPKIVVVGEGRELTVDLKGEASFDLKPGDYTLELESKLEGRELYPNKLIVLPDEPRTLKVAVVGEFEQIADHTQPVTALSIIPAKDRYAVLSGSLDQTLGYWQPGSGVKPRFANLSSPVRCLAATSDGALAATAGGNKQPPTELHVQLWDAKTLDEKGEPLEGHTRLIVAATFSPDGKQLLTASSSEMLLWNVAARTNGEFDGQESSDVLAASFASNGKRVATGDRDGRLVLWDCETRKPIRSIEKAHDGPIRAVIYAPKEIATAGDDGRIRLWDLETFKPRDLLGHKGEVLALAISPDQTRLLSGGSDETVRLWSIADGKLLFTLKGHKGAVQGVAFTPDGRHAVSGGADRTVRLWRLPF